MVLSFCDVFGTLHLKSGSVEEEQVTALVRMEDEAVEEYRAAIIPLRWESDVEDALCRIEGEAVRTFYHYSSNPPVRLASVLDRLLPWIIMAAFVVAVTAGVIMGDIAA
jgi:hypothetical protein